MTNASGPAVIFLCTGNICRSPLAEALARQMFPGMTGGFASAGLAAAAGHPASRWSVAYAAANGGELAQHRSQPVTPVLLSEAAWVIGMTRSHAAIFRSRWQSGYAGAIGILGAPGVDLAGMTHSPAAPEVDDPYGRDQAAYFVCGDLIRTMLAEWRSTFADLNRKDLP